MPGENQPTNADIATELGKAWDAEGLDISDELDEALTDTETDAEDGTEDETELEAADDEDSDDEETDEDETEDEETEPETPTAPEHWSKQDKSKFDKLPDDAKQWWLDKTKELEKGYQTKFEETANARQLQETVDDLFKPFKAQMEASGLSEADVIRDLVSVGTAFETKPLEAIQWVVNNYGRSSAGTDQARDLVRKIASNLQVTDLLGQGGAAATGEDEDLDPRVARKVAALESEIQQLKQGTQQQQQQALREQQQQVNQVISDFKSEKDESGNPKHPHFDKVKEVMGAFLATGKAKSMEDAYTKALYADDELREEFLSKQAAEKAKANGEKRRSTVNKAKKASTPKTRANGAAKGPKKTVVEELEAAWESSMAGRV